MFATTVGPGPRVGVWLVQAARVLNVSQRKMRVERCIVESRWLSALDASVANAFDVIAAEEEEYRQRHDSAEHRADKGEIPLRCVLLLEDAQCHIHHPHIRRVQVQQRREEIIPHALELKNEESQ